MYNKDLFEKISCIKCSPDELDKFITNIDKKEFDLEKPFEKYYSVDTLISAIEKYQLKEIDCKFLAYWLTAYNWIIMGGFKNTENSDTISLKDFIIWEICDWIDSLSFFDDDDDFYNFEVYKNTFKVLDTVLQDIIHCKAVFAENSPYDDEGATVLITNDSAKYYIKLDEELNFCKEIDGITKTEIDDLENRAKHLMELGYKGLEYYN